MKNPETDLLAIDQTVAALYEVISIKRGGEPDWERFRALFYPRARLISNTGEEPVIWTVEEFSHYYKERISGGTVSEFYEGEISGKTDIFGNIAHRFSTYQAIPPKRGINSIQLLKAGGRWRITSIIWNDETDRFPIPEKYLAK